jgi:hypothetical protein
VARREVVAQEFRLAYGFLRKRVDCRLEYTRAHQGDCKFALRYFPFVSIIDIDWGKSRPNIVRWRLVIGKIHSGITAELASDM